jgi:hypothetical protein
LLLGFVQGLQAGALRRRLPVDADGGVQQNQDLDNGVSPSLRPHRLTRSARSAKAVL